MGAVILNLLLDLMAYALMIGMASLTSTWALLKGLKPRTVVAASSATIALAIVAFLAVTEFSRPQDLFLTFQKMFDDYWKVELQKMVEAKMTQDEIGLAQMVYEKYIFQAFPAWLAVNCLLTGLLAYYLSSSVLSRITPRVPRSLAFRDWVIPEPLIFGPILGALLKIASKEGSWIDITGNNLLVFFAILYGLGGISIILFLLSRLRLSYFMRFALLLFVLISIVVFKLVLPVCLLGILDVWFDFRKIKSPPPEVPHESAP